MIFDEDFYLAMGRVSAERAISIASTLDVSAPTISPSNSYSDASAAVGSITGTLGSIKDKYIVNTRILGSGSHGSVRECIDRATGMRYAVKRIRKSNPRVRHECIAREIIILREMKHTGIAGLVDVYEDSEYVHLVTDLCEGGELFHKIFEKSSHSKSFCSIDGVACFTEGEAARIVSQILNAVCYMHHHGVVHRDLKPENILFETADADSPVKIVDFGLARKHSARDAPMANIAGTPYYIAPEVLRRKYDKSCDMWSVGVIAYVLLCGYPPFNGVDDEDVHQAIRNGWYCFPCKEWSGASREVLDFIRCLLEMDAGKRMTAQQALSHPWIVGSMTTEGVQPRRRGMRRRVLFPKMRESYRTYIL